MELVFPWMLYIGVPVVLVLAILRFGKKDRFKDGRKVANTSFIEESPYYKKLLKQYKVLSGMALLALLLAILVCFVMVARPARIDRINPELHNRDIFMCMDISSSVDELNLKICDELRNVVKELNGERFGITIFNGRSVLVVPLTTDYNYVLDTIDKLEEAFKYSITGTDFGLEYDGYDLYLFKYEGTSVDYGSSFIGDGLASCLYNFPDLKENTERSRMIVFTTDNELNGEPMVTVDEAAALCKKNNVKVFAVTPKDIVDEVAFREAMESTGGGFYEVTSTKVFEKLIEDIRKTETSAMEVTKIVITDQPEMLFILLLLLVGIYFALGRKVRL